MHIPDFYFAAGAAMDELARPFLTRHSLSYFQYCRIYKNRTLVALSNRPDFLKARADQNRRVLSSLKGHQLDEQTYVFLWNGNLPHDDTRMAREFGIDNGICFVQRYPEFYNLIAFASPTSAATALSFYSENLHKLFAFVNQFTHRGQELIGAGEKQRIAVPEQNQDTNQDLLLWAQRKRVKVQNNRVTAELSWREFQCWRLTALGSPIAEIAEELEISPRTVETYMDRTKTKLGVEQRSELTRTYFRNFPFAT